MIFGCYVHDPVDDNNEEKPRHVTSLLHSGIYSENPDVPSPSKTAHWLLLCMTLTILMSFSGIPYCKIFHYVSRWTLSNAFL